MLLLSSLLFYSPVRSPFWFRNCCQPLLPVPGSVDCYFFPFCYRPSWVNLLRFCEFCGFHQSIFFHCFLFRWISVLDWVLVFLCVLFMFCRASRCLPQGLSSVRSVYVFILQLMYCVQWFFCAILLWLKMLILLVFLYFIFALKVRFSPNHGTKK